MAADDRETEIHTIGGDEPTTDHAVVSIPRTSRFILLLDVSAAQALAESIRQAYKSMPAGARVRVEVGEVEGAGFGWRVDVVDVDAA